MATTVVQDFRAVTSACLVYKFSKPGVSTLMAQPCKVIDDRTASVLLVFDTGAFT